MGQAREAMDRMTRAVIDQAFEDAAACYAPDAVVVTPDRGEIRGRDAIRGYYTWQAEAFPDGGYQSCGRYETGKVAVDEGYMTGTHTRPLALPSGESLAPTGRRIRVRSCDVATVEGGLITAHRIYFDQMEFLGQLGMLPDAPS